MTVFDSMRNGVVVALTKFGFELPAGHMQALEHLVEPGRGQFGHRGNTPLQIPGRESPNPTGIRQQDVMNSSLAQRGVMQPGHPFMRWDLQKMLRPGRM